MPNEIKYESMIYKVHMVYKNAIYIYIYILKYYVGGQMWKKITKMLQAQI